MNAVLRGVGQIFLQRSVLAGLCFLAALTVGSPRFALAALVGSALGWLTGRVLRASREALEDGLYGFNGALVALATTVFFEASPLVFITGATGVLISTALFHVARRAVFTAPFVVCTWGMLAVFPRVTGSAEPPEHLLAIALRQVGEVIFLRGTFVGALCLSGLFASSWRDGAVASAASLLALALGATLPVPTDAFSAGLLGFNAVLAAIAVMQLRRSLLLAFIATLVATALSWAALHFQFPALTAPFVLVAALAATRRPARTA